MQKKGYEVKKRQSDLQLGEKATAGGFIVHEELLFSR